MPRKAWEKGKTAAENAGLVLPKLAGAYFDSGRKLASGSSAPAEEFHRFRLAGKRLRYTLEVFQPCYGASLDPYLESLKKAQNILGEANDCETSRQLMAEETSGHSRTASELQNFVSKRTTRTLKKFRRFWKTELDRPGSKQQWMRFLRGSAHEPGEAVRRRKRVTEPRTPK
jgi:CHAD domain-containing protein